MGKKFKIILMTLISFTLISGNCYALDFHERLVNYLMQEDNVEKNMVVERSSDKLEIEKANYKFAFSDKYSDIADNIRLILIRAGQKAKKFSYEGGKDGVILIQIAELSNGGYTYYNYKFSHEKNQYKLLISVSFSDNPISMNDDKDFNKMLKEFDTFKRIPNMGEEFNFLATTDQKKRENIETDIDNNAKQAKSINSSEIEKEFVGFYRSSQHPLILFDSYGCPMDTITIYLQKQNKEFIESTEESQVLIKEQQTIISPDVASRKAEFDKQLAERRKRIEERRTGAAERRKRIEARKTEYAERLTERKKALEKKGGNRKG